MQINTLKGRNRVQNLFENGSFFVFKDIKIVYTPQEGDGWNYGVTVPKRFFKSAVKRNLLKRRMRELIRAWFKENSCNKNLDFMIIYNSPEIIEFGKLKESISKGLNYICKS